MLEKKRTTSRGGVSLGGVETPVLGGGIERGCMYGEDTVLDSACFYRMDWGRERADYLQETCGKKLEHSILQVNVNEIFTVEEKRDLERMESGRFCVDVDGYEEWRWFGEKEEGRRKKKRRKRKRKRKRRRKSEQ
ncbi:hypothetical protein ACMFMF_000307 [Clarireedia jacksonii]